MNPLRRLFRRRPSTTVNVAVATHVVHRPIALAELEPSLDDRDAGGCWWGAWDRDANTWIWDWDTSSSRPDTHWLPASVDVLPVRCYPPEVG